MSEGSCPLAYCEDVEYWKLDESHLERCCKKTYTNMRNAITDQMAKACTAMKKDETENFGDSLPGRVQRQLWNVMENPESGSLAKLVSVVSVMFVVISTICMCVGTIRALQETLEDGTLVENSFIDILETMSVIWFTVEYILRFMASTEKLEFLRDKLNILDVAAVLPFYVPLCISWLEDNMKEIRMEMEQEQNIMPWTIEAGTGVIDEARYALQYI